MKAIIRNKILDFRKEISREEIEKNSKVIAEKLELLDFYKKAKNVFIYISIEKEVNTRDIIKKALEENKDVYVPKVVGKKLEFFKFKGFELCRPGWAGILEPTVGEKEPIFKENSIAIVPGLVFDESLNRIGFGKGYYDRYLGENRFDKKIGLAFEFQIVKEIETDIHDIKMDMVLTESRILED